MTASPTCSPAITVTVKFFSARSYGNGEPFMVIRQRNRSDHDYPDVGQIPDLGQQMTWQLCWEHTTKLAEEAHGGADEDITEISRAEAEQIMARLAARLLAARGGPAALGGLRLPSMTTHRTPESRGYLTGIGRFGWARSTGNGILAGRS